MSIGKEDIAHRPIFKVHYASESGSIEQVSQSASQSGSIEPDSEA